MTALPDPEMQPDFYADVPFKRLLAWVALHRGSRPVMALAKVNWNTGHKIRTLCENVINLPEPARSQRSVLRALQHQDDQ